MDRKGFIGASDAAAVLGLSRWQTPLAIWAEKTGQIEVEELDSEACELGTYLEEYVARRFTKKTGKVVHRVNEPQVHPVYPFLTCQIDRRVVAEDALLECKTASAFKAKEWVGEDIPREYIVQVMHQLAVTGKKIGYVAVLIGNQDFKIKKIERDEKTIAELVKKEVAFWNEYIVPKVMPGIVTKNDAETLYELFPLAQEGTVKELGDKATSIIESRNALIQDKIQLEGEIEKQENELRLMMGENESGIAGKWKVTWKNHSQKRVDTKALPPEIYEKYSKVITNRILRIREESNGKN